MSQRRGHIAQVGEVLLVKRRGAKSLRLSVTSSGQVRVSMPPWTPYVVGMNFAISRKDWLLQQLERHKTQPITAGTRIGKLHRVWFRADKSATTPRTRLKNTLIEVRSASPITSEQVQAKLVLACERALKDEAMQLLVPRLDDLAKNNNITYHSLRVRKMASRWGSCSREKVITLNSFLVQLPWELIDYVIVHELVHTKHLNHGPDFWREFERIMPDAKKLQRQMRTHNPHLQPH